MIALEDVWVSFTTEHGTNHVLKGISAKFEPGGIIGILGHRGQGKSTLIELLTRRVRPTQGALLVNSSISWPMSSRRPLLSIATVRSNIRFVAMIYRVPPQQLMMRAAQFGDFYDILDVRINEISSERQSVIAHSMCLALGFDYYVADESMYVGPDSFRERVRNHLDRTASQHTVILTTRHPSVLRRFCQRAFLLHDGKLSDCGDPAEAIRAFRRLAAERDYAAGENDVRQEADSV